MPIVHIEYIQYKVSSSELLYVQYANRYPHVHQFSSLIIQLIDF